MSVKGGKEIKAPALEVVGKHRYHFRPQVSTQIPEVGVKWAGRCCLSIATLGHAYPMPHLSVYHLLRNCQRKEIPFYPITDLHFNWETINITKINKYNKKTEQHFYNEDKNKQAHPQN